jgi:sugar phosphate isomerase/epimerase
MRTAVQLYTLRGLGDPVAAQVRAVAEAGFDGVEFAGVDTDTAEEVATVLADTGLAAPAAHVGLDRLEADVASARDACGRLGVSTVVVPIVDRGSVADAAGVDATAARLDALADAVPGLTYHNHEFEFADVGGESVLDRLLGRAGVRLELDVGWATAAGADPVALLERHAEDVSLLHLKDVALDPTAERGARSVDLGEGDVPLDDCLAAAREADVEWAIFEHDDPETPVESLGSAARWLDSRGL